MSHLRDSFGVSEGFLGPRYPEHYEVTHLDGFGPETRVSLKAGDFKRSFRVGDFQHFPLEPC